MVLEEMYLQENTLFDPWSQNVAQYPLHHVAFRAAKFEVTRVNGLGGYAFTRKYII